MEIVAPYVSAWRRYHVRSKGMKTCGDPVTCIVDIRSAGYLISKAPGVLFVGRRGISATERNDGHGIDLSGESRPISRRPRDIGDCDRRSRARTRRGTGLRPRCSRDICICHGAESSVPYNMPYVAGNHAGRIPTFGKPTSFESLSRSTNCAE